MRYIKQFNYKGQAINYYNKILKNENIAKALMYTTTEGHFVEYEYVENCYIGRNTLSYDGVAWFKDPLVFFGQQEKSVYTEVVFIFKQER